MVASGFASRGLLFTALGYAADEIPNYLTGLAESASAFAVTMLELLIAFGGITVVMGGLALLVRHRSLGRVLIYLGGGAGLLGLVVSFAYTAYKLGLDSALELAPYWVGLGMAVASRRLARGA